MHLKLLYTQQRNGKYISWDHFKSIYEKTKSSSGLTLLPKIKYEHTNLTNFSKMRVDLAAQVILKICIHTVQWCIIH